MDLVLTRALATPERRRLRLAAIVIAVLLAVFIVTQLALPPLATSIAKHRLKKFGQVNSIYLSSFPAVQLAWEHVNKLDVQMDNFDATPAQLSSEIAQAGEVSNLNFTIGTFRTSVLTLHDVVVTKSHGEFHIGARLELADLRKALPIIQSLTPLPSPSGKMLFRGTAEVLGLRASVDTVVEVRDGKVVVAPTGLLGALATITVFHDPHLYVQSVSGRAIPGGLSITARAAFK